MIQKFTLTLTTIPVPYSEMSLVSPQNLVRLGTNDNTLSVRSVCEIGAVNGPSKNAYYQLSYDNSVVSFDIGSSCISISVNGSTSICTLNIPSISANAINNILLTKIKSLIPSNTVVTSTTITVSSWSFFSVLSQFYTTCLSTLTVNIQPQILNPITSLSSCNPIVGQTNTLTVEMNVENAAVLDVLVLKSFSGVFVNRTGSISLSYNSSSNHYETTLSGSQIINSTRVRFTVSFTNPTYLPSAQPSFEILLRRTLSSNNSSFNTYAQTSSALLACPVTQVISNSTSNLLAVSNTTTYKSNVDYSLQFTSTTFQLKDYLLNDYFIVTFKNRVSDGTNFA